MLKKGLCLIVCLVALVTLCSCDLLNGGGEGQSGGMQMVGDGEFSASSGNGNGDFDAENSFSSGNGGVIYNPGLDGDGEQDAPEYEELEDGRRMQWEEFVNDAGNLVMRTTIYHEDNSVSEMQEIEYYGEATDKYISYTVTVEGETVFSYVNSYSNGYFETKGGFVPEGSYFEAPQQIFQCNEKGEHKNYQYYDDQGKVLFYYYVDMGNRLETLGHSELGEVIGVTEMSGTEEEPVYLQCTYYSLADGSIREKRPYHQNGLMKQRILYENGKVTTKITYNEQEQPLEEDQYDGNEKLISRIQYEYHENGNIKKNVQYNNGSLSSIREYNEKGSMISESHHNNGKMQIWTTYYDSGNVRMSQMYDDDGGHTYTTFAEDGKQTGFASYDADNRKESEYQFDKNGNVVKELYYYEDGQYSWCDSEYDKSGRCSKYLVYNSKGDLSSWYTYEYDKNNNRTKAYEYDGETGALVGWTEYQYNATGECTEEVEYDANGKRVN